MCFEGEIIGGADDDNDTYDGSIQMCFNFNNYIIII